MIHSALSDEELFVSFSWICDKIKSVINEKFFVVFISIFFLLINPPDEGLILWSRSPIPGMFRPRSGCEDDPPSVEEILELHASSCGWNAWWRCGTGSASGRHKGIEA